MKSRASGVAAALLLMFGLVGMASASGVAQEPGIVPGIPRLDVPEGFPPAVPDLNISGWQNLPQNGLAGATAARQWARLPLGMLAANISLFSCDTPGNPGGADCSSVPDFGLPSTVDPAEVNQHDPFAIQAFFVSPEGAPEPYGFSREIPVRSVAFGTVPVEVVLQIEQARDGGGLPFPIQARFSTGSALDDTGVATRSFAGPGVLRGEVRLHVRQLALDGVNVALRRSCRTPNTALEARSDADEWRTGTGGWDVRRTFVGLEGGSFNGELDIPSFSGCVTTQGDDLSPLLTSALSGPGNPFGATGGTAGCFQEFSPEGFPLPTSPGTVDPVEAGCQPQGRPYPDNPEITIIPEPWEIPEYAPSEGAAAPVD